LPVSEVFLQGKKILLQVTNLRRTDTSPALLNVPRARAFFLASGDPLGENPNQSCQLFSISVLGRGIRQVTHFNPGRPLGYSYTACFPGPYPGSCSIARGLSGGDVIFQDPMTRSIVFNSSCDPLGANPFGDQVFGIRPDGTGLRQLTDAAGLTTNPDGSIRVELAGPSAYSAPLR
jgi:hypothetical protein